MANPTDITSIMRDIAAGRKNEVGDHWGKCWCNNAADEIDELRKEVKKLNDDIDQIYMDQAGADI